MILDVEQPQRALRLTLPQWSAAEVLDTPFNDNLTLRAMVCRLGPAQWQWTILSIEDDKGELISMGVASSLHAARVAASSEITKCAENPLE